MPHKVQYVGGWRGLIPQPEITRAGRVESNRPGLTEFAVVSVPMIYVGLAQGLHKNMIFLNFNHVKNNPTQAILLHVLYMLTCALKKDCCSYRLKINHVTAVNV
jgi:hypothetical protein